MKKTNPKPKSAPLAEVQTPGQLVSLALAEIEIVKGFNPRRTFDEASLAELADSIRAAGIIEPLIVRRDGQAYKLVAGERRLRAAKLAGLKDAPCLVRELGPDEALRLAVLENLQRQDVSALEEAEGFARLIKGGEFTADTLAAKLGKSREHVYGRLRLLKLDAKVLAAMDKGQIEASVAGLLAKFPPKLQPEILSRLSMRAGGTLTFREAKEDIAAEFQPLADAPFLIWTKGKCSESWGTSAPLCFECPHNSANMPDMGEQKKPVCLNAECYGRKVTEHGRWQIEDARKAGRPVVELERKQWGYSQRETQFTCPWQAVTARAYDLPHDPKRNDYLRWSEWAKVAGITPALAVSPSGAVIEVIKCSEVREKLIELGKIKAEAKAGKAATKEERRAVLAENKAKRLETARLGAACLVKARQLDELDFWRWFWLATDKDYRTVRRLGELLGIAKTIAKTDQTEEAISAALLAAPSQDRQEKLLQAYLAPNDEWEEFRVEQVAEELKVK